MRRWGFRIQTVGLLGLVLVATVLSMLRDYQREGFHPDDHDDSALLERWSAELFGPEGALADHLH